MPEWASLGREVLAQLSAPVSLNFSDATKSSQLDAAMLTSSGGLYVQILEDLDSLVATDTAFLLGPWLESARKLGGNATDCMDTRLPALASGDCGDFMEWNARDHLATRCAATRGAHLARKPVLYCSGVQSRRSLPLKIPEHCGFTDLRFPF